MLIEKFDIRSAQGADTMARSMSGGNQQKAIIAREINADPKLLIAVQPTRGLDVGAMMYIHEQLLQQRKEGKAILLISLELDEVFQLSDRILVIYEGKYSSSACRKGRDSAVAGSIHGGFKGGKRMNKIKKWLLSISPSLIAILSGVFAGFIIMLISNPANAFSGLIVILKGG